VAVLIVSAELDEIYALADRIAVMYEGKITGFRPPTVPAEELGLLMAGGADQDPGPGPVAGPVAGPEAGPFAGSEPPAASEPTATPEAGQ
jgi:general nucleoside transport system ATP-binding protein